MCRLVELAGKRPKTPTEPLTCRMDSLSHASFTKVVYFCGVAHSYCSRHFRRVSLFPSHEGDQSDRSRSAVHPPGYRCRFVELRGQRHPAIDDIFEAWIQYCPTTRRKRPQGFDECRAKPFDAARLGPQMPTRRSPESCPGPETVMTSFPASPARGLGNDTFVFWIGTPNTYPGSGPFGAWRSRSFIKNGCWK